MKELNVSENVSENVYDIIETYLKYKNEHLKIIEKEYDS